MTGRGRFETGLGGVGGVGEWGASGLQDDGGRPALAFRNNLEPCEPEESNQLFSLRHFKEFWVAVVEREKGGAGGDCVCVCVCMCVCACVCVCVCVCVWAPGVCSFLRGWDVVR